MNIISRIFGRHSIYSEVLQITEMMSFCPKCRSFYDDKDLKFCLNDGVPLTNIKESGDLWNEAEEAIRQTTNRIRRETRKTQIKKIVSILITTILTILVISVITINSWLFFNPKIVETASIEKPLPSPEPTIEIFPTPFPTAQETISPTPTPTPVKTPLPKPTKPKIPDEPFVCSQNEKIIAQNQIQALFGGGWREQFLEDESRVRQKMAGEVAKEYEKRRMADNRKLIIESTEIMLANTPISQSVNVSPNCQIAVANVSFEWKIISPQFPVTTRRYRKRFLYRKAGNGWRFMRRS